MTYPWHLDRLVIHDAAAHAVLNDPGVRADLVRRGVAIAQAAGEGVEVHEGGKSRARITVRTETFEAMYAEATDRTLTRALDAGRK